MEIQDFLKNECQKMLSQNGDIEEVLDYLRRSEYSKTKSMVLLTEIMDIDLGKAKEIVHFSQTWKDAREAHEQLHKVVEKLLEPENY